MLEEAGIEAEGELILRRVNTADGRKTAWVNDRRVSGEVLRDLADIQGAAVRLNRALAGVQVSNLASLRLDVVEQPDVVGSLRKLAESDQPGLFDAQSGINAALASLRGWVDSTTLKPGRIPAPVLEALK